MVVWYRVAWINPLFAALDTVASGRNHAQDGTIGDLAHAQGVSGHNPDDTPGVRAEREDADTKPEVRAADGDSRFNGAPVTMEDVVQAVLRTPAERDRLIYIIFNRRIWRKANGWREERYTGDDPHDTHAHFSGDPASDEDGRAWTCILALVATDETEDEDMPLLAEGETFLPITIPPVGGTAAVPGPADVYLNGGGDFFGESNAVALRIYCSDGAGHWTALPGYADGLVVLLSGHVFSAKLAKGTRILSVSRWGLDASGRPAAPLTADGQPAPGVSVPSGPVAFTFERK